MCIRDSSWGHRDWPAIQHWRWFEGQAGPDLSVHFFEIHSEGIVHLRGYIYKEGRMSEVTSVDFEYERDRALKQKSFKAVVHDAVVGSHCYIGIGAVVVGVEVPDGRFVPHGAIIDTADAVERLSLVSDVHREFNEDVVEVNRGLVAAYREHEEGPAAVRPRATEVERRGPSWDQRWQPDRDPSRF